MTFSDDDLREALTPIAGSKATDAADAARVLAALARRPHRMPLVPLVPILLAAAAGLVLGFFLGSLTPSKMLTPTQDHGEAKVVAATGDVYADRGREKLRTGSPCTLGTFVQTQDAKCSFLLPDGSEVDVDHHSYVRLDAREVYLKEGEVIVRAAPSPKPFELRSPHGTTLVSGTLDATSSARGLDVTVLEGTASLLAKSGAARAVARGQSCTLADGTPGEPTPASLLEVGGWLTELLAMRGEDARLQQRIHDLLQSSNSKSSYAAEDEIRALGTLCVVPLARFILASDPKQYYYARHSAASLIADLASWQQASYLLPLLEDPDPEVRVAIFHALARITGTANGTNERMWAESLDDRHHKAIEGWKTMLRR